MGLLWGVDLMSIDHEVRIAELEAELEMITASYRRAYDLYKNRDEQLEEWKFRHKNLCRKLGEALTEDCMEDGEPIKPISEDRMGEIVEKVRGKR